MLVFLIWMNNTHSTCPSQIQIDLFHFQTELQNLLFLGCYYWNDDWTTSSKTANAYLMAALTVITPNLILVYNSVQETVWIQFWRWGFLLKWRFTFSQKIYTEVLHKCVVACESIGTVEKVDLLYIKYATHYNHNNNMFMPSPFNPFCQSPTPVRLSRDRGRCTDWRWWRPGM